MAQNKFKQLCFNELTLKPECGSDTELYNLVVSYAKTLRAAMKEIGAKMVRYHDALSNIRLSRDASLHDLCKKSRRDPAVVLILSTHTMPQVDPDEEQKYDLFAKMSASVVRDGQSYESSGLAAAYIYDVPMIGFASEDYWEQNVMHDTVVKTGEQNHNEKWPCLANEEHLDNSDLKTWLQNHSELELIASKIPFEKKTVSLRDDHGKDVLLEHATSLCRCDYVDGVLCSLPFKPKHKDYILDIREDGIVDVVLYWEDRGLSMRVKTTGRNLKETNAIAAILKENYGK